MGEPACSGVGPAQATGRAWVIRAGRIKAQHAVVVGRAAAGVVVAWAGVCAARAVALATVRPTRRVVGGGGQR